MTTSPTDHSHDCVSEVVVCSTRRRRGGQSSDLFCLKCTNLCISDFRYNLGHCHIRSPMIRPSSDAFQMGMIKNTEGSSMTLSTGVRPTLQGKDIKTLDSCKYLGAHFNNKVDWTTTPSLQRSAGSVDAQTGTEGILTNWCGDLALYLDVLWSLWWWWMREGCWQS